jgi:phosphatidylinositol alpha-mannosyltransferase
VVSLGTGGRHVVVRELALTMRVALLHPFSWPEVRRGGERYAHDLARWLAQQGHDVDYVTGGTGSSIEIVDGFRRVRLPRRRHPRLEARGVTALDSFGVTVAPWLARHRYDVVHAMVPAAAVMAAVLRQRVVYTAIGHPGPLAEPGRGKDRWLIRRAMRSATVTTVLSASAADATLTLTGTQPLVVPPGVRLDVFTADRRPRQGPPALLFAAAHDPRKRLDLLLAAMPAVLDELPDARLRIAGPGVVPDSVPEQVRGATDVAGVGAVDDVARAYREATLTVLPAVDEAFGLVLAESMACGTPVVGVESGSMPEIVSPAVGRLATPDDPGALARAIIDVVRMAADPATPAACAEHAAQWGWDVIGPVHESAYRDALRSRRS